jgi:hypothetical protein
MTEYRLGTSYPPTALDQFATPIPTPMKSDPILYPVTFPRGDSSVAGHGNPTTIWLFQVLTEDQKIALAAICTISSVERKSRTGIYITTRTPVDIDTFDDYTATMILPDWTKYREVNGLYRNVPIEFRKLVEYSP